MRRWRRSRRRAASRRRWRLAERPRLLSRSPHGQTVERAVRPAVWIGQLAQLVGAHHERVRVGRLRVGGAVDAAVVDRLGGVALEGFQDHPEELILVALLDRERYVA